MIENKFLLVEKNISPLTKIFVLREPEEEERQLFDEMLQQNNITIFYYFENHQYRQYSLNITDTEVCKYPINFDIICQKIQELSFQNQNENQLNNKFGMVYAKSQTSDSPQALHYCLSTLLVYLSMHFQSQLELNILTKVDSEYINQIIHLFQENINKKQENGEIIIQKSPSELFQTISLLQSKLISQEKKIKVQLVIKKDQFLESSPLYQEVQPSPQFNEELVETKRIPTGENNSYDENLKTFEPCSPISRLQPPPENYTFIPQPRELNITYQLPECPKFKSFKQGLSFKCLVLEN